MCGLTPVFLCSAVNKCGDFIFKLACLLKPHNEKSIFQKKEIRLNFIVAFFFFTLLQTHKLSSISLVLFLFFFSLAGSVSGLKCRQGPGAPCMLEDSPDLEKH